MDLEKLFDRVNHDVLMSRLARRIKDKRILKLIHRYLQAGMMAGGVTSPAAKECRKAVRFRRSYRTVLLDELDKELERRGLVLFAAPTNAEVLGGMLAQAT